MAEQIAEILRAIGMPEHRVVDLARDIAEDVAAMLIRLELPESVLTDAVYLRVYSSPRLRREVNYDHPLDSLR
jgi:hypothetical protein